jgi:hypothetical protein
MDYPDYRQERQNLTDKGIECVNRRIIGRRHKSGMSLLKRPAIYFPHWLEKGPCAVEVTSQGPLSAERS